MTAPKITLRPRRQTTAEDDFPPELVAWFEGTGGVPWAALLPPGYELLPKRWLIWKSTHPAARPPAGYEWLDGLN